MGAIEERAKLIVEQMTLSERIEQVQYDSPAIKHLGGSAYNWWNGTIQDITKSRVATIFPEAIGLAATFNKTAIFKMARVIALEARAKYNSYREYKKCDMHGGLTFCAPNINIFRDPRQEKGYETYGEDPYLTSRLGVAYIKGLQGEDEYWLAAACAKYFSVQLDSEEAECHLRRHASKKDLYETYLPAFEAAVKEAKVAGVMEVYSEVNEEETRANHILLINILRKRWGFRGYIISAYWMIKNFNTGYSKIQGKSEVETQVMNTQSKEKMINEAVERLMGTRLRLGLMDEKCKYNKIGNEVNEFKKYQELSLELARESMVLLKNQDILPLDLEYISHIGVIGPTAKSYTILGNYNTGPNSSCITFLQGIQEHVQGKVGVHYAEGCRLFKEDISNIEEVNNRLTEAVTVANDSDIVVLCLGMEPIREDHQHEINTKFIIKEKERMDLIEEQQLLLEKVIEVGKPTILILSTGHAVGINYAAEHCHAILQTWYPGIQGGKALAELLFGKYSPSGKLPITFYKNMLDIPEFEDYSMEGRTYRFITREPLYPFGYGLSYGNIKIDEVQVLDEVQEEVKLKVKLHNESDFDVKEVIQVYIRDVSSIYAVPNPALGAFKCIRLKARECKIVEIELRAEIFTIVDEKGDRYRDSNEFEIYTSTVGIDDRSISLTGRKPNVKKIQFQSLGEGF